MPLVGIMLAKADPRMDDDLRIMRPFHGHVLHDPIFDLDIGFGNAVIARMIQGVGLAFLFVPINTVAYSYLPREKNNAASGLINLARNVGAQAWAFPT